MGITASSHSFYRLADGTDSASRSDATIVSADDIINQVSGNTFLAPGLFVGIGIRETALASNENDIDYDEGGNVVRHTYGVFQLDTPGDLDLATTCNNAISKFEGYANDLMSAAGLTSITRDVYAYICWAHNAGESNGQALDSVKKYGLDWAALKARPQNDYVRNKLIPYAEAVMAQVDQYPAGLDSSGGGGLGLDSSSAGLLLLLAGGTLLLWVGLG